MRRLSYAAEPAVIGRHSTFLRNSTPLVRMGIGIRLELRPALGMLGYGAIGRQISLIYLLKLGRGNSSRYHPSILGVPRVFGSDRDDRRKTIHQCAFDASL